jgi:hypothetical protein
VGAVEFQDFRTKTLAVAMIAAGLEHVGEMFVLFGLLQPNHLFRKSV